MIGKLLRDQINVSPGEKISVVTSATTATNPVTGQPVPVFEEFTVTGVFETGMFEYDNAYMYVDLAMAQRLAGLGADVTGLEVRTADRWKANLTAKALETRLGFPYF
ncbi:MAG: hypothetical protein F6K28_35425, partial [Microcoleus sp. SIO2G3]|nr:hypothetical protein [Microcoleus sp. SIO2G3]